MKAEKILTYTVVFEKAKEGGYVAYVPLLPGCMTQGETFEETKENVKDAIKGYIEVLKSDREAIPIENEECISMTVTIPIASKVVMQSCGTR